jgi:hypothetical protein
LRKRLAEAQQGAAIAIVLPKGEYRLRLTAVTEMVTATPAQVAAALQSQPQWPSPADKKRQAGEWRQSWPNLLVIALLLLILLQQLTRLPWQGSSTAVPPPSAADLWLAPFRQLQQPVLLIVGDYYLYAEQDEHQQINRLVRDFQINSAADLALVQGVQGNRTGAGQDVGLSYLPASVALPLSELVSTLRQHKIRYQLALASEVSPAQVRQQAWIYLGQLSGLGPVMPHWLSQAAFEPGDSYDQLVKTPTGEVFRNATPWSPPELYPEFSYIAQLHSDNGLPQLLLSGVRDQGLLALPSLWQQQAAQRHQYQEQLWAHDSNDRTALVSFTSSQRSPTAASATPE